MTYEEVKKAIEAEKDLPPGKRKQQVPCAYCTRGGNGDKSCSCGMSEKKYSKYKMCFAGTLLPEAPGKRAKKCPVKPMTLDEAIAHCDECADATPCGQQHKQLADWLRELKAKRSDSKELCDVLRDCLFMARRFAARSPATESVIFDPKTRKEIRTLDYRKIIERAVKALEDRGEETDV